MNRRLLAIGAVVLLTGLLTLTTFASSNEGARQGPPVQMLADEDDDAVDAASAALEDDDDEDAADAQDADDDDDADDAQDADDDADDDGDDGHEPREVKGIPDKSESDDLPPGIDPDTTKAPPFNPDLVDTVETPGGVMVRVPEQAAEHMEVAFEHGEHGDGDADDADDEDDEEDED